MLVAVPMVQLEEVDVPLQPSSSMPDAALPSFPTNSLSCGQRGNAGQTGATRDFRA